MSKAISGSKIRANDSEKRSFVVSLPKSFVVKNRLEGRTVRPTMSLTGNVVLKRV